MAVGDAELEEKFTEVMNTYNMTTVSKWSLLSKQSNEIVTQQIKKLNFDQQAIIDHEILMKSTHMFGVAQSTYSFATAVKRGKGDLANCNCHLYMTAIKNYLLAF